MNKRVNKAWLFFSSEAGMKEEGKNKEYRSLT
jgi:hypothetical protein